MILLSDIFDGEYFQFMYFLDHFSVDPLNEPGIAIV